MCSKPCLNLQINVKSSFVSLVTHFKLFICMLALCILFYGKKKGLSGLVDFILLVSEVSSESIFP